MFKPTQFKAHPHDLLVRLFLNDRELFADFLGNYLEPEIVELLDLDRLHCESTAIVDGSLDEHIGDLRFSTVFKNSEEPLEVFIFLEHQSSQQPLLPFRMLKNIVDAYGCVVAGRENAGGKPGRLFPYPLAIILYHGKMPWRAPLSMRDLIATVPGLDPVVLDFPIHLVDLSQKPTDEIKGHPALRALLLSLQAASQKCLGRRFETIFALFTALQPGERVREWMRGIWNYVAAQDKPDNGKAIVAKVCGRLFGPQEGEKMAKTLMDEVLEEGEARGIFLGKAQAILVILSGRLGPVPKEIREQVMAVQDEALLDDLLLQASICTDFLHFKNWLDYKAPPKIAILPAGKDGSSGSVL